jgi:hypothetical protein
MLSMLNVHSIFPQDFQLKQYDAFSLRVSLMVWRRGICLL